MLGKDSVGVGTCEMAASPPRSPSHRRSRREREPEFDESLAVPVLQLGDEVPNFVSDSTVGTFDLHHVIDGSFAVLVTLPSTFEPVATTELGMLSKMHKEFGARDLKLIAIGMGTKEELRRWIEEVELLQDCTVNFPIVADDDGEIHRLLGLVRPNAVNARKHVREATSIIVLDIDRRIRVMAQYPSSTGRNFYETIRAVDSLQLHLYHQVVTPANWVQGDEVFITPGLGSLAASSMFPQGFNEARSWYRATPQPDIAE